MPSMPSMPALSISAPPMPQMPQLPDGLDEVTSLRRMTEMLANKKAQNKRDEELKRIEELMLKVELKWERGEGQLAKDLVPPASQDALDKADAKLQEEKAKGGFNLPKDVGEVADPKAPASAAKKLADDAKANAMARADEMKKQGMGALKGATDKAGQLKDMMKDPAGALKGLAGPAAMEKVKEQTNKAIDKGSAEASAVVAKGESEATGQISKVRESGMGTTGCLSVCMCGASAAAVPPPFVLTAPVLLAHSASLSSGRRGLHKGAHVWRYRG
jgi:hypothetical protein